MPAAGVVIASLADGRLMVLDELNGQVVHEERPSALGAQQIILSGAAKGLGLALGTIDGSILLYAWEGDTDSTGA